MEIEKGRIEKGDEVFAALTMPGQTVVELHSVTFGGIDDVLLELRKKAVRYTGISKVSIRNRTRGWMLHLPLMLCRQISPLGGGVPA